MYPRCLHLNFAVAFALASTQLASAQPSVFRPIVVSPYSRTSLSPYINLARGAYPTDFRNPLMHSILDLQDLMSNYEMSRPLSAGGQGGNYPPRSYEDWIRQRENETRFSPSGQPIAYSIYSPYYDGPSLNSFVPSAINRGRQIR